LEGAQWLHVVDLDGAKDGIIKNLNVILKIAKHINIPIEMGGGIRTHEDIETLIHGGVKRVILGTKAIENRNFLKDALRKWPNQIAISLDCKDGFVAQRGWVEETKIKATDMAKEMEDLGVPLLVYTDIARDGMLTGPNLKGIEEMLKATHLPIIASGGISGIEDIKNLLKFDSKRIYGTIIGKALYEEKISLKETLLLCSQKG
jgi:phosphoribosylformimino-5-aminoimidazole carboxamide ribotide isomerase